jgi:hypothetical protein
MNEGHRIRDAVLSFCISLLSGAHLGITFGATIIRLQGHSTNLLLRLYLIGSGTPF